MNYELLPIEITQNGGHHYRQVWRDDHGAVYEQRNAFGAFLGYEAIAIKRAAPCHAFGRDYPARELPTGVWEKIRKAILTCAVGSDGNTNGSLFDLARIVRRYEEELIKRFSLKILTQIIEQWQSANSTNLNLDKDYLIEFLDKLSLVRFPAGMVLVQAFKTAKAQSPPSRLKGFSSGYQLLSCLCRELQRQADIAITSQHYLDKRQSARAGLGSFLSKPPNVIELSEAPRARRSNTAVRQRGDR